jgi:protease I
MKNAVILTADKFEDLEVMYPLFRLQEAGWHTDVAAPVKTAIHGEGNYGELMPDLTLTEVIPDKYDLLIIPGGSPDGAPAVIRKNGKAREIARNFFEKNKPVASVCHGPWTLADADLVKGRCVTSYWHDGVPEALKNAGALWVDNDVVVDGNLVTSRYPPDLPAFMREVMKLISGPG